MKKMISALLSVLIAGVASAQTTPIEYGKLFTDLNANNFGISNAGTIRFFGDTMSISPSGFSGITAANFAAATITNLTAPLITVTLETNGTLIVTRMVGTTVTNTTEHVSGSFTTPLATITLITNTDQIVAREVATLSSNTTLQANTLLSGVQTGTITTNNTLVALLQAVLSNLTVIGSVTMADGVAAPAYTGVFTNLAGHALYVTNGIIRAGTP